MSASSTPTLRPRACRPSANIHRRGRFADAALAGGDGDDVGDAWDGAGAMAGGLRRAAGDRRSGWWLRSAASAVAAAGRRPGLAVGGEGDGDGLDSRHILHRLLGGPAQRFELRGPGRIDGNGEIDLAAANDDLGDEPERDDVVAEVRPLDVLQRVEHVLFEDGFRHDALCILAGAEHQQSNVAARLPGMAAQGTQQPSPTQDLSLSWRSRSVAASDA